MAGDGLPAISVEGGLGTGQEARCGFALLFHAGEHARLDGGGDGSGRDDEIERRLSRPLAGAFLPGLVEHHIDQRLAGARIFDGENLRGDLDQIRLEGSVVPVVEDPRKFVGAEAEGAVQHVISFGDELHVAVLDAVVHHLDEVPGAVGTDVGDARAGIAFGGDGGEHGLKLAIGFRFAAGHEGRAVARAFFAAGDAHAEKAQVVHAHFLFAALRVLKPGVAAVDENVARLRAAAKAARSCCRPARRP